MDAYTQNVLDRLRVNASHYERRHKALGLSDLLRDAADLLEAWAERTEQAINQATQIAKNDRAVVPTYREKPQQRKPRMADVAIAERRPAPPCNQYEQDLNDLLNLIKELHK